MDEITTYKVYVKTNTNGFITAVNSSAFLHDADGWTLIDEGTGDRYRHAQGNYLDGPLMDENGVYRYKLVDGIAAECTAEEMATDVVEVTPEPTLQEQIELLADEIAELHGLV